MRPTRYFYILVVLGGMVLLSKAGCISVDMIGGNSASFRETRTTNGPAGRRIEVRTQDGAVSIRRGEGSEMTVTSHLAAMSQERLDKTQVAIEQQRDGGVLVTVHWAGGHPLIGEGCGFEIVVPAETDGVNVDTSNGAITLASLSGTAHLGTSNGEVTVTDHHGKVGVDTSNGAIVLSRVVGDVNVDTSNGKIEMSDVAGRISAGSSNGSVTVGLAEGSAGPVDVETSNASVTVGLPSSYAGRFSLSTSNGSVHCPQGERVHDVEVDRNDGSFAVGSSNVKSTVRTSNGSIDVRFAQ